MSEFQKPPRLLGFMSTHLFEEKVANHSCTFSARRIIEEAKSEGFSGKILEVRNPGDESPEWYGTHSYVCLDEQPQNSPALNQMVLGTDWLTKGDVVETGHDITDEILNTPWERL